MSDILVTPTTTFAVVDLRTNSAKLLHHQGQQQDQPETETDIESECDSVARISDVCSDYDQELTSSAITSSRSSSGSEDALDYLMGSALSSLEWLVPGVHSWLSWESEFGDLDIVVPELAA